jgi:hypothetical protein
MTIMLTLLPNSFPGAGIDPQYQAPVFDGLDPVADVKDGKIYHGSCHCGAVKMAVKTKPLDHTYDERIIEGDCSICSRVRTVGLSSWSSSSPADLSPTGRLHLDLSQDRSNQRDRPRASQLLRLCNNGLAQGLLQDLWGAPHE